MSAEQTTALSTDKRQAQIKATLEKARSAIANSLPSLLGVDRQIRITLLAVSKQPKLLECSPVSILQACLHASQLGLEFGGPLGHAYPVPYWNTKKRCLEAQCIVGYRGLIDLAMRSGELSTIEAHAVYERDQFVVRYGLNQELSHAPELSKERGSLIAAYALARYKDGGVQFDVMGRHEIDGIRERMKKDGGPPSPWDTDYQEMARKTVIRRIVKSLRLKIETHTALADALEKSDIRLDGDVIDVPVEDEAQSLTDKVRARKQADKPELPTPDQQETITYLFERLAEHNQAQAESLRDAETKPADKIAALREALRAAEGGPA